MDASKRRQYIIITAVALILSFFLPWVDFAGTTFSPWAILTSGVSLPAVIYLLWLVPAVAVFILALQWNRSKDRWYLYVLPLLCILVVFLWAYTGMAGDGSTSVDDEDPGVQIQVNSRTIFMKLLTFGFWFAALVSVVLLFLGLTKEKILRPERKKKD